MSVSMSDRPRAADDAQASVLALIVGVPGEMASRARRAARTSPGRLRLMMMVLVVLTLASGIIAAVMVQSKQAALRDAAQRREPVMSAAHQLFRSLADADATTVISFLHGGQDRATLQARYHADIQRASQALTVAATDVSKNGASQAQIREITANLPIYTGLVERAYANQRLGFPVGTSYLHEAYNLMTDHLLQPASQLSDADYHGLLAQQDEANGFPWWSAVFVVLLLAALIFAHLYLRRRTRRLFNVGLSVAVVSVVLALLWSVAALTVASVHAGNARDEGSEPAGLLQQVELNAITGRAVATLGLINRNPGSQYEKTFQEFKRNLMGEHGHGGLLARAADLTAGTDMEPSFAAARKDLTTWLTEVHPRIAQLSAAGQGDAAVRLAVGTGTDSAGTLFNRLDDELLHAIKAGRVTFAKQTSVAGNAMAGLQPGILALTLVAVIGVVVGLTKRLQEYR